LSYKRINLSFDLRRDRDVQAYAILSSKKYKTDYVVNLLLNNEDVDNFKVDINLVKQALSEVLEEMNISIGENKKDRKDEIPEEIFDIFDKL
jgi:hypothetical protein